MCSVYVITRTVTCSLHPGREGHYTRSASHLDANDKARDLPCTSVAYYGILQVGWLSGIGIEVLSGVVRR